MNMNGPIRVINVMGARATPAAPVRRPVMGQLQSEALKAAAAEVVSAQGIVDRILAGYDKLVRSMSKDDAQQAYQQAVDSLKKAQQNYDDVLSLSRPV